MCLPTHPFAILKEWDHAGLKCAVTQSSQGGHLCGYVRVPPDHPLYGVDCDHLPDDIHAHGGVNLAKPEPCEHEDGQGWWFGFDCSHGGDLLWDPDVEIPWMQEIPPNVRRLLTGPVFTPWERRPKKFWRQPEVEAETARLAEQLSPSVSEAGDARP